MILKSASFLSFWCPNCCFCCGNIDFCSIKMSQICSGRIQQLWAIPILLVAVWIRCFPSPIRVHNTQIPRFSAKVEQDILQWKIGKIVNIIQVEQLKAGTKGEWEKWSNSAMEVRGTGKRNSLIEPGNKKGKKGRWK